MRPEEREELLAAYALGTLSGPDAAAVEELVRTDRAAAHELSAYHEMVDMIALSVPLRRADPSLRARVLQAARRTRIQAPRGWPLWRTAAAAASIAVLAGALGWAVHLQQALDRTQRDSAAIASVVEANAKQIQSMQQAGVNIAASEALRVQLQTAVEEQELVIAIATDPRVRVTNLDATSAGHGATARYLWSTDVNAGLLIVRGLAQLPIDSVYQVWLDDGREVASAGTFTVDARGNGQHVVHPGRVTRPVRVSVAVAAPGGDQTIGRLVVLTGAMEPASR